MAKALIDDGEWALAEIARLKREVARLNALVETLNVLVETLRRTGEGSTIRAYAGGRLPYEGGGTDGITGGH